MARTTASRSSRLQRLSGIEIAILAAVALLLVVGIFSASPHATATGPTQTVQVRPGDTLWSIATLYPVAGLSTAQTAEKIAEDNQLRGRALSAGSVLRVPAPANSEHHMASR
jgi:Tfp pilus assembly protein FimV